MHPNPAFRQTARERNIGFARSRAFGILSVNGAEGPMLAHVPFLLSEDGATADLHLVRSNPVARHPPRGQGHNDDRAQRCDAGQAASYIAQRPRVRQSSSVWLLGQRSYPE